MRQRAYLESAHRVKEVKPQAKVVCVYPGAAMRCCWQIGRMINTDNQPAEESTYSAQVRQRAKILEDRGQGKLHNVLLLDELWFWRK